MTMRFKEIPFTTFGFGRLFCEKGFPSKRKLQQQLPFQIHGTVYVRSSTQPESLILAQNERWRQA
jgi:hypothetical protein